MIWTVAERHTAGIVGQGQSLRRAGTLAMYSTDQRITFLYEKNPAIQQFYTTKALCHLGTCITPDQK